MLTKEDIKSIQLAIDYIKLGKASKAQRVCESIIGKNDQKKTSKGESSSTRKGVESKKCKKKSLYDIYRKEKYK